MGVALSESGCASIAMVNVPASALDVRVSVADVQEAPTDGKVIVSMQFLQGGSVVELSNASLSCNGVPLTWNGLAYWERVPMVGVGGTYTCRHDRLGVNTDATITVPPRPVFVAPTVAGAVLQRSASFSMHYVPGNGVSVWGSARSGTGGSGANNQPDDGTHDGHDVSALAPGAGTLSVQRRTEGPIPGPGFLSANGYYDANKTIAITWQ